MCVGVCFDLLRWRERDKLKGGNFVWVRGDRWGGTWKGSESRIER